MMRYRLFEPRAVAEAVEASRKPEAEAPAVKPETPVFWARSASRSLYVSSSSFTDGFVPATAALSIEVNTFNGL